MKKELHQAYCFHGGGEDDDDGANSLLREDRGNVEPKGTGRTRRMTDNVLEPGLIYKLL